MDQMIILGEKLQVQFDVGDRKSPYQMIKDTSHLASKAIGDCIFHTTETAHIQKPSAKITTCPHPVTESPVQYITAGASDNIINLADKKITITSKLRA